MSTLREMARDAVAKYAPKAVQNFAGELSYTLRVLPTIRGQFPRECPICGYKGLFRAFGETLRLDAMCKQCGSLERHRLFYLRCVMRGDFDGCEYLLHFAPEPVLKESLRQRAKIYRASDFTDSSADFQYNIEDIDAESDSVGAVVCNHVLEHVDDTKALKELYRILKAGGALYCMVPLADGWCDTYENSSITDEIGRTLHFGQFNHVRYYGGDFPQKLINAGFEVEELTASGQETARYGLLRGEKVFVCRKPN